MKGQSRPVTTALPYSSRAKQSFGKKVFFPSSFSLSSICWTENKPALLELYPCPARPGPSSAALIPALSWALPVDLSQPLHIFAPASSHL